MTLQEIRELDRAFLIPDEIAPILGCSAYAICVQVREDKQNGINSFPFPTIRVGNRTKIPRLPFLAAMGIEEATERINPAEGGQTMEKMLE